ncbi:hypothetical protein JCM15519_34300 [Fundidesulfovibrio butyratiphilus]
MKKIIMLALASCFLFSSMAFAFEGKSTDTSKKSSYVEMMKKKKAKKKTKTAAPVAAPAN